MILTNPSLYDPHDSGKFPTLQLGLLAFVRVAEPIALTSIYPYAWKLVLAFDIGDKDNASFFAGLLIAAFSLAEALTSMHWGVLSDRYGRKPILLFGCAGTIVSLLIVGISTNFWIALAGRLLGGLLNGNIGVVQTMVGELVQSPEHEPRAYAIMPFVWSIGTIIGPAIGGCLSNPSENFPSVFSNDGVFAQFPFLLPNLVCASLLLVAIIAGYLAIEETHPHMQRWSKIEGYTGSTAQTPLMPAAGATAHSPANLSDESYGTFNQVNMDEDTNLQRLRSRTYNQEDSLSGHTVLTRRVMMIIIALGIFTYHAMTFDSLLPIFLQDKSKDGQVGTESVQNALSGGLGFSVQEVGIILSFNGIIALFIQAVIFPAFASWLGIWRLFVVVTIGHPFCYFVVPFLTLLPHHLALSGVYFCLILRNFFSILGYPVILILLKEAAPTRSGLGKINGLAAAVGAACRTVASPISGLLYTIGSQAEFSALPWWSSTGVAFVGTFQLCCMSTQKDSAQVRTLVRHISRETLSAVPSVTPQFKIEPIEEEEEEEEEEEVCLSGRESVDEETCLQ